MFSFSRGWPGPSQPDSAQCPARWSGEEDWPRLGQFRVLEQAQVKPNLQGVHRLQGS